VPSSCSFPPAALGTVWGRHLWGAQLIGTNSTSGWNGSLPRKNYVTRHIFPPVLQSPSPPNNSRSIFELKLQYSCRGILHGRGRIKYPLGSPLWGWLTLMFPAFLAWIRVMTLKVEVQARRLMEKGLWKHKVKQLRWNQKSRSSLQSNQGNLLIFILNFWKNWHMWSKVPKLWFLMNVWSQGQYCIIREQQVWREKTYSSKQWQPQPFVRSCLGYVY